MLSAVEASASGPRINHLYFLITNIYLLLGGGDNCAILDFSQRHLTGHSWTYLRDFQKRRIFFFEKLPPCTAKTVFENPKGGAFGCAKTVFAVRGGNFARKKILQNQKFLKYVQECPVKCLWLKSEIAQLSYHPTLSPKVT